MDEQGKAAATSPVCAAPNGVDLIDDSQMSEEHGAAAIPSAAISAGCTTPTDDDLFVNMLPMQANMDNERDVDESTTSTCSANNQDTQIFVTVPGKLMLDSMLGNRDVIGETCPIAKILGNRDVIGEIMLRVGSTRSMISFSAVNSACLAAKKNPGPTTRFAKVNKPAFVGFLVSFKQLYVENSRLTRLIYPRRSGVEESAVAIRKKINPDLLARDTILSATGGCIMTAGCGPELEPTDYYIHYPSEHPKKYTHVASNIPKVPKDGGQTSKNTYGQFGLIRKERGPMLSFFVKDWANIFVSTYEGARVYPKEKIYIHVSELVHGTWNRHVSPPIDPANCDLFHRNPYSILHGDNLFLMYLVRFVVRLDLNTKTFTNIFLPTVVTDRVSSWHDYTIYHHSKARLAMIHYWGGMLYTWLLTSVNEGGAWKLESVTNLIEIFGSRIPSSVVASMLARDENPIGKCHKYTVQLRSSSPAGRFVLLTLGFDPSQFIVDMIRKKVYQINQQDGDGPMGRVYALTEQWPPKI